MGGLRSLGSRYQNPNVLRETRETGWRGGRELTLLLVPQQMGLALELLATLIAGRQALSLHLDGTIVVERQAGVATEGRFIWGASGAGMAGPRRPCSAEMLPLGGPLAWAGLGWADEAC
jgi:hypothetical protein